MGKVFWEFSKDEVSAALKFARSDHWSGRGADRVFITGVKLDRETLHDLANRTGAKWYSEGRKPGRPFYLAKRTVMQNSKLRRSDKYDVNMFRAYSSAISKLFSNRRHGIKLEENHEPSPPPSRILVIFEENGQGAFVF